MKDDTILVIGGLAVGGLLLYKSDFFGKIATGIENVGTGLGGGVQAAGTGFGYGVSYTGQGLYQAGTGAGTLLGGSSISNIITALRASNPQYFQLPTPTTPDLPTTQLTPGDLTSKNPNPQPTPQTSDNASNVAPSQETQNLVSNAITAQISNLNTPGTNISDIISSAPSGTYSSSVKSSQPAPPTTIYSIVAPSQTAISQFLQPSSVNQSPVPSISIIPPSITNAASNVAKVVGQDVTSVLSTFSSWFGGKKG